MRASDRQPADHDHGADLVADGSHGSDDDGSPDDRSDATVPEPPAGLVTPGDPGSLVTVPSTTVPADPCDTTTTTTVPVPTDTTPTTTIDPSIPTTVAPPSSEVPASTVDTVPVPPAEVTEVPVAPVAETPASETTMTTVAAATAEATAEPAPAAGETTTPTSSNPPLPPVNPTWTTQGVPRFVLPSIPGSTSLQPGRTPAGERVVLAENVDVILATIRQLESSNRYDIGPNKALASGAYQYIPRTWNNYAGYPEAYLAPPEVQDERARGDVERILSMYGGNVAMVPVMWYYPRAAVEPLWMDRVPNPAGGNRLTIREYQTMWLEKLDANASALLGTYVATPESPAALSVVSKVPTPTTTVPAEAAAADAAIVPTDTVTPTTVPPTTVAPTTVPPTTVPPTTVAPAIVPPTTVPPTTVAPAIVPPTTVAPAPAPEAAAPAAPAVLIGPPAPTTTVPAPTTTVPVPRIVADEITVSESTMELATRSVPPAYEPTADAGSARSIVFPVLGPVAYADGWMDSRDGGRRRHEGTDIVGVQMQPILAVVDGEISRLQTESVGIRGVAITIRDSEGWRYNYFHDNNDTPGTDDGQASNAFRLAPGLAVGSQVVAGQIIGYMGDSGNAEDSVTHLHFEFRDPYGVARPSYWSLRSAEARQACTIGIGPWSTPILSEQAELETASLDGGAGATPDAAFVAPSAVVAVTDTPDAAVVPVEHTVVTPMYGEGQWVIDSDGRVTATGDAALILPARDLQCDPGPATPFGTDAAGWREITSGIVDGTVLEGADLSRTILSGLVPEPPEPAVTGVPAATGEPLPAGALAGTVPQPAAASPIASLASVGLWPSSDDDADGSPPPAPTPSTLPVDDDAADAPANPATPSTLPVDDTEPIGEPPRVRRLRDGRDDHRAVRAPDPARSADRRPLSRPLLRWSLSRRAPGRRAS